jgi:hypothetical protein
VVEADDPLRRMELYRLLRESELVFPVPFHPELEGRMKGPIRFVRWICGQDGKRIPIFTSPQRAEEAFKKVGVGNKKYSLAAMKGTEVFRALSTSTTLGVINWACATGALLLDAQMARGLADGSVLKPIIKGKSTREVQMLNVRPEDYPTDLLQVLFRHLRQRPAVRAVWLLHHVQPANDPAPREYVFALLADGDVEALKQELMVVATAAVGHAHKLHAVTSDPQHPGIAEVMRKVQPFYAAPDYQRPGPPAG